MTPSNSHIKIRKRRIFRSIGQWKVANAIRNVYDSSGHIKKALCGLVRASMAGIQTRGKLMYSVLAIADELLRLAKASNKAVTPLKLMKLTYVSQGWNLAINGEPLFGERIEAWKYGPVIPDLYHATKMYGAAPIPFENVDETKPHLTDEKTRAFLADVFSKYGDLSGVQLSSLTHKSGTPWSQVFKDGILGIEIPREVIKTHYLGLLNERNRGATT